MFKIASILILAGSLAACNLISDLTEAFKNAKAVASDLEQVTGSQPQVGFDVHNGRLTSVTVIFPTIYDKKPLRELAGMARTAIGAHFKQTPTHIVLGFSVGTSDPGTTAALPPIPDLESAKQ